jgi:hypothetical protein
MHVRVVAHVGCRRSRRGWWQLSSRWRWFLLCPRRPVASTAVPVTTLTVTSSQCAGGAQSQIAQNLQNELQGLLFPPPNKASLPTPVISPNPGCDSSAPSEMSSIISASNTVSSSRSGAATVSSEALGKALFTEEAYADVDLTAAIPLSAPASFVEVSIPYTTSGVTWSTPASSDQAEALVFIEPTTALSCVRTARRERCHRSTRRGQST